MRKSARALLLLLFAIFFFAEFLLFIYLCLFQFYRPLLILADGSSNPHIQQKIQTQYRDSSRSAAKIHFAAIVWIGKYASTFADIFRFRSIRNSHALIVVKNEILFEFECSSCQRIYYWSQQSWIVVWFYLFFVFFFHRIFWMAFDREFTTFSPFFNYVCSRHWNNWTSALWTG